MTNDQAYNRHLRQSMRSGIVLAVVMGLFGAVGVVALGLLYAFLTEGILW